MKNDKSLLGAINRIAKEGYSIRFDSVTDDSGNRFSIKLVKNKVGLNCTLTADDMADDEEGVNDELTVMILEEMVAKMEERESFSYKLLHPDNELDIEGDLE